MAYNDYYLKHRITSSVRILDTGCWQWQKAITPKGYGRITVGSRTDHTRQNVSVHRLSYKVFNGPLLPRLVIDHLCGNRACVNPEHLEQVTQKENVHRANPWWKQEASLTHCKRGHEFNDENTGRHKNAHGTISRNCKQCSRKNTRIRTSVYRVLDKLSFDLSLDAKFVEVRVN